ncbi:MAG: energy-coupling factor transporter ATPase [Armatimonadota bacterium]|nr:energy-coupling factor transporter ATPase [Armatimonadota bacterium]MDR7452653.1 energy-coupling factor transporter ATPase [Armatimonadota bacterium]MDR7468162.1 energy-coupling factor transporter ATPase [Armatimonadota bacterium]MDR7495156.1 energy-coupling factor transporter ATPase [Armatimonadota bacterium]MDR7499290.1 energy-coupling factor transporter ATPase [Armatimonadota bacterium]
MAALIEVRNLRHVYNAGTPHAVVAVDGVSMTIERGEFVAIVGGNGSGKSTLAKHLNALLLPTEGEVRVDGLDTRDRSALWEIRRRVGMVFQNPDNQLVATVVEEDVAFGPENLGLPPEEIARRVAAALTAVEMLPFRRAEPHLLSGGQKQRVAIAGVLAMRPECLILDEATTMLDPQGRREVLDTVQRLNRSGVTVILITHSMDEAALAHRVIALFRGHIALEGPPERIFDRGRDLEAIGLGLPLVPALARALREDGLPLRDGILFPEHLVDAVAQLAAAARGRIDGVH